MFCPPPDTECVTLLFRSVSAASVPTLAQNDFPGGKKIACSNEHPSGAPKQVEMDKWLWWKMTRSSREVLT